MTFDEVLDHVREMLQSKGRMSYRALKRRFDLDDNYLEDLKAELIKAEGVAVDENGEVLVWVGNGINGEKDKRINGESEGEKAKRGKGEKDKDSEPPAAERRQLTVMFCDLVGSTALSAQLDPEEFREVVRSYQQTSAAIIERYSGHIAQYLGDGLLVYFGYPVAHEDDAARAVRAGLEIIKTLRQQVPSPFQGEGQGEGSVTAPSPATPHPTLLSGGARELKVRIGIHTGLVVIGEIGGGNRQEQLALGETPNIAARIQGHAHPDEVEISGVTHRLVEGLFDCEERGQPPLKGVTAPLTLYHVRKESAARSRFETVLQKGLTQLVGRDEELALLGRRWEQAKDGEGQVVLLSGEAGIGKSRLVQELKDIVSREGAVRIEFRCSPYHQNSAFYPILDHLQRLLQFAPDDTPQSKLAKLQQALLHYQFPQAETLPLLAALLSLPQPDGVQPLTWSPQKQKEKTQEALVAWLVEEAARQAVYLVWEDLHWIDPSSLDVLTLLLQQLPSSRALVVLTYRPDFTPPWHPRAHSTQLTLGRLGKQYVAAMVNQVMTTTGLSTEVVQQIVSRTDGVPLFIEELTKSVAESVGAHGRSSLPSSAIPATLHDSLMARLDRLGTAKAVAQLGATLGREFSYELLQAVAPVDATALRHSLQQLVDAELLYQRGLPPQATYLFKHALIQDTAYQSLLKSTRQQYHCQIAQVLETRFPETVETQPELLAYHYTEAGLTARAIPYWHKAGQRATEHSGYVEAISYLTKGLELLKTLPNTPERNQQELTLQVTFGPVLIAIKGYGALEVEQTYARARELCQQIGETPHLFSVLHGLRIFYLQRELVTALELGNQLSCLAQNQQDPAFLMITSHSLGAPLLWLGEIKAACEHMERGLALYDPQQHNPRLLRSAQDYGVTLLSYMAWALWFLGYPARAIERIHQAITLAQELSHPLSLAYAQFSAGAIYQYRREAQTAQKWTETVIALSSEQGFPQLVAFGTILRAWALAWQGQQEEGLIQLRQGLTTWQATGAQLGLTWWLALLAEAYERTGQTEEGLTALAEAMAVVSRTGERMYEAELYRLKGEFLLAQEGLRPRAEGVRGRTEKEGGLRPRAGGVREETEEADQCFLRAIEIAQKQQAKSFELRAVMSLVRLRQYRAQNPTSRTTQHELRIKLDEAHKLLLAVYNWFTEGFDTKDLQEAKALLEELA